MAALYACTKCHQRFPFEALSQGQQLCKVRGPGRRPGTGTLEARAGAPRLRGRPAGGPRLRAWQARRAEEPHPSRWGLAGLVGESQTRSGPPWRRVRLLSNRGVFSDPGRAGEWTAGPQLGPNQPRWRSSWGRLASPPPWDAAWVPAEGTPAPPGTELQSWVLPEKSASNSGASQTLFSRSPSQRWRGFRKGPPQSSARSKGMIFLNIQLLTSVLILTSCWSVFALEGLSSLFRFKLLHPALPI